MVGVPGGTVVGVLDLKQSGHQFKLGMLCH